MKYEKGPNNIETKSGDWICGACGNHNFARRDVCNRSGCGVKRPVNPGDKGFVVKGPPPGPPLQYSSPHHFFKSSTLLSSSSFDYEKMVENASLARLAALRERKPPPPDAADLHSWADKEGLFLDEDDRADIRQIASIDEQQEILGARLRDKQNGVAPRPLKRARSSGNSRSGSGSGGGNGGGSNWPERERTRTRGDSMDISSNSTTTTTTTITTAAATTSGNINIWSERSRSPPLGRERSASSGDPWQVPPAARDSSRARRGDEVPGGRGEGVGGVAGGRGKYEQYDDAMTHTGRTSKPELPLPESALSAAPWRIAD